MFGKGVYLADIVSKSANYTYCSPSNPEGLMLLCEAALGNKYRRTASEYVTKLKDPFHSTYGVGGTAPDPKECIQWHDGMKIPMGKPVRNPELLTMAQEEALAKHAKSKAKNKVSLP